MKAVFLILAIAGLAGAVWIFKSNPVVTADNAITSASEQTNSKTETYRSAPEPYPINPVPPPPNATAAKQPATRIPACGDTCGN